MSVITESELREMWRDGRGRIPPFPPGTRFSPAAQDFLKDQHLETAVEAEVPPITGSAPGPDWDKPGTFPVMLTGPTPVCAACGQLITQKPGHMTQLDAGHYAPKTTQRLILRGRLDSLHATVMLTAAAARHFYLPDLARPLDTLAAYCREMMSAEYNLRQVSPLVLLGKNEEELHQLSHWPDRTLGIPHIVPGPADHEMLHWLNLLRTQVREVEIVGLETYAPGASDLGGVGASINRALNRLSSAVYVLELYFQSGKITWREMG